MKTTDALNETVSGNNLKLKFGFYNYDRTRALSDGTVKIEGVDASFESADVITEIFERMISKQDFDVSELGMTYFLRVFDLENCPFIALPVFVNRAFRHSAIYINTSKGINKPEDLAGKTMGEFALFSHDAGTWPKGILSDEYGVKAEQCRWIIGGLDWPMPPVNFVPKPYPKNVDVSEAPEGTDLGAMLEAGEIDALISADIPKCILKNSPMLHDYFLIAKVWSRTTSNVQVFFR